MTRKERYLTLIKLFSMLAIFMWLSGCQEVGQTNFQTMLENLAKSYNPLWRLLTATAYVIGFGLTLKALHNLKVYGEARTMMSSQSSIKSPILYLLAASFLIFIPTGFHIINITLFASPNPLSYNEGGIEGFTQTSVEALIGLVQLIGLIAFIRGWLLVAKMGEQAQPGTMGRALTHIIGGALAINIVEVAYVVFNTFGYG